MVLTLNLSHPCTYIGCTLAVVNASLCKYKLSRKVMVQLVGAEGETEREKERERVYEWYGILNYLI